MSKPLNPGLYSITGDNSAVTFVFTHSRSGYHKLDILDQINSL